MGLIRGGIVVILSSVLFLTIFLGNLFLTVSSSLEYETLEPNLNELASGLIENFGITESINENSQMMEFYCLEYDSFNITEGGIELDIPCSIILAGSESIIEYGTAEIIKQVYFDEYNCEFWECVQTQDQPFVLISEKAKDYWHSNYRLSIIAAAIIFLLLFLLTQKKRTSITIAGILIIISSIPFRKINWALSLLPEGPLSEVFALFFTRSYNVFLSRIIIGSIILLVGLGFEFFGAGMKLHRMFKKAKDNRDEKDTYTKDEVKELVKEEIKNQKQKKTTPNKKPTPKKKK